MLEFSLKENSKDRRNRIINFDHKLVQSALEGEKETHTHMNKIIKRRAKDIQNTNRDRTLLEFYTE